MIPKSGHRFPGKIMLHENRRVMADHVVPHFHNDPGVASIEIVFDEGVDVGSGFSAVDDIDINGFIVERDRD